MSSHELNQTRIKLMMSEQIGRLRYGCKYPMCKSKYYIPIYKEDYYNKRFYRFPKHGPVSRRWKEICNLDHSVMTDNFFVCEDHFQPDDFMNHAKNRLKVGAIPAEPPQSFGIGDHDYFAEDDVQFDASPECSVECTRDKYSFLFDLDFEACSTSGQGKKLAIMNVHQVITLTLLRLKNVLHNERHLLRKLIRLYDGGKFANINPQLVHVSNEFLQANLESTTAITTRKWSKEDHFLALSFYNRNEKLYKYLSSFFHLPPAKKLKHMLASIPLDTGTNKAALDQLKLAVTKMTAGNQTCVLLMDEMMLTSGVNYDETSQRICGYQDMGANGRAANPADRVLVFMARGLKKDWTQIVSHYFSSGPINVLTLQNIIVRTIKYLQELGLSVVTLVCRRDTAIVNAVTLLTARTERRAESSYFLVNHKRISVNFDVRYLLKETKNALSKCKILYDKDKTAKLEHIESAYNIDQSKRIFKQLRKLKDRYFEETDSSDKTDVTPATAILSHTVAASIETFVLCGDLPEEAMNTAEFVEIMDLLFDSLTGTEKRAPYGKKYRCALSLGSPHCQFWSSLLTKLNKWKLMDLHDEKDVTSEYPFVKGWRITIESLFYLWSHLRHVGCFGSLSLDRFNLKPLEDFLKRISQYGSDDKSPTCRQFLTGLKTENLKEQRDGNCYDSTTFRAFVDDTFDEGLDSWEDSKEVYFDDLEFDATNDLGFHEEAAYLSGYLLQKLDIPGCDACRSHLLAEWVTENGEYTDPSTYPLYASDEVVRIADKILYLLYLFLRDKSVQSNLEDNFKALYRHEFESFKFCGVHSCNEDFINLCVKLGICRFTHSFNKAIHQRK